MKIKCVITDIDWDIDGEETQELPKNITFEMDYDSIYSTGLDEETAEELAEQYGFCIKAFNSEYYNEDGFLLDDWGDRVNKIESKIS